VLQNSNKIVVNEAVDNEYGIYNYMIYNKIRRILKRGTEGALPLSGAKN
jgi:hypothetical protein